MEVLDFLYVDPVVIFFGWRYVFINFSSVTDREKFTNPGFWRGFTVLNKHTNQKSVRVT